MSGVRPPHLNRRNGVYHLRMRVPDRLRGRIERVEVWKSLHTYSSVKARQLAAKVSASVQETFTVIEQNSKIDPAEARRLIQACFVEGRREVENDGFFIPDSAEPEFERFEQDVLASDEISRLGGQLESHQFSLGVKAEAVILLRSQGIDMTGLPSDDQEKLLQGAVRVMIEKQRLFLARLYDPLAPYEPVDPIFFMLCAENPTAHQSKTPVGITLGHAVEEHLKAKEGIWRQKTLKARKVHLSYLADFLGADQPLASLTAEDIRTYRNLLPTLRANHGRQKHLSFQERLTESSKHQIRNKTASLIFEAAKAFLRWANEEEGLISANPAADVKWPAVKTPKDEISRRPFKHDELHTLFSSTIFTGCKSQHRRFESGSQIIKDDRYWIAIIGYYTGARLGEIVQLHLDDVLLDHEVPHFDLNEKKGPGDPKHIKSKAGVRKIPIHPDLLELGFAEFVAKRRKWNKPCKRLFSEVSLGTDGQASTQFSKMFARILDQVGLTDPALTFHSFRHGVADAFRDAGAQQYTIDAILGHSDGKVGSLYGEGPSLKNLALAISQLCLPIRLTDLFKGGDGEIAGCQ